MPWADVFVAFVVCHLVGDFIFQTEFQATNKHGGLGRDHVRRRALFTHALTYTACYVPALVWLAGESAALTLVATAAGIGLPHALQDDGRAVRWWLLNVKHTSPEPGTLAVFVDQSLHMVTLLALAVAVGR